LVAVALAQRMRSVGSYRLRLAEPGDKLQWVANINGAERIYDSDPEVDFGTQLKLWLFSPFVSEGLL
jgi:putative cardiolipin synthase